MTTSTPWVLPDEPSVADPDTLRRIASSGVDAVRRRATHRPERWLPAADLVLTAVVVSFAVQLWPGQLAGPAAALLVLGWGISLRAADAWRGPADRPRTGGVIRAGALLGLGCWLAEALLDPGVTSGHLIAVTGALVAAALVARLLLVLPGVCSPTRVTVAGDAADVRRLLVELRRGRRPRWEVASICLEPGDHDEIDAALVDSTPIWAGVDAAVTAALAVGASAIVIAPGQSVRPEDARRLSWSAQSARIDVLVATGLHDVSLGRAQLLTAGDAVLAAVRRRDRGSPRRAVKEAGERLLAAVLLLLLLPVLAAIAVIVSIDSPGGPLFCQERVGRGNAMFRMYKFRTMTTGADQLLEAYAGDDEGDGVRFKIRHDPRVTRVGALLRRYSLDELPQLVNVLRGQMSLVGPRPALSAEVAQYDEDSRHRLVVKPGLTGLWQVSGRSDLTWDESVRLDLHYVDNWSLALDAWILLRTLRAVVGHRGAY